MSQQFIQETSRLQLRPFAEEDALSLFLLNSDPLVLQYTGDVAFNNEMEAAKFILQYDHYRRYGYGRWAVIDRESKIFLGWCGLKFSLEKKETDIGFRFFREYWGRGYATEAAIACVDYGFNELGLTRVIGRAKIGNVSSLRVLQKIGMIQIGSILEGNEPWHLFEKTHIAS